VCTKGEKRELVTRWSKKGKTFHLGYHLKIEERQVRSTQRERERHAHTHTHTTHSGSLNNVRGLAKRPLEHNTWKNVQYKYTYWKERKKPVVISVLHN
jgi:hypothetical protein